ncbi:MAG TPA: hypothetical protein PK794_11015, partial [Armatimonadota bacterium]|nr:hypothetical protein [Armatimonadota bacterium]
VIIGRLIPAGTGMDRYRDLKLVSPGGEIRLLEPETTSSEQDFVERLLEESDLDLRRTEEQAEEMAQAFSAIEGPEEEDEDEEVFGFGGADMPGYGMDDEPHLSDDAEI